MSQKDDSFLKRIALGRLELHIGLSKNFQYLPDIAQVVLER
jgi:hypothetical protein